MPYLKKKKKLKRYSFTYNFFPNSYVLSFHKINDDKILKKNKEFHQTFDLTPFVGRSERNNLRVLPYSIWIYTMTSLILDIYAKKSS